MASLFVVSGTTSGIGKALAELALKSGNPVLAVSRREAPPKHPERVDFRWDMSVPFEGVSGGFAAALTSMLDSRSPESVCLINNAGTLGTVGPVEQGSSDSLRSTMNANFHSHRDLTLAVAGICRERGVPLSVLSVSTGAATQAISGWSEYCSSKAAFDLWFRCFRLETASRIRSAVFYPGVVDTRMQKELRETEPGLFPDVGRFIELKKSGKLLSPERVAGAIVDLMSAPGFGDKPAYDVRELLG
ncbi:MAG TPA: SDR family NAD(P)-dependent oxidoreductase [Bdellovibrionota bacterium]|nr:SDR family NAD(P)-dependent oxidoreductase [Bdellovibrionota bacterium]